MVTTIVAAGDVRSAIGTNVLKPYAVFAKSIYAFARLLAKNCK